MPREELTPDQRTSAQIDHSLASVAPVHEAMGIAPDAARARELVAFYDRRPTWAVPGSVPLADAMFLAEMVHATQPRTILEVGVAAGCSTAVLAWASTQADPNARVIALDALDHWYIDPSRAMGGAAGPMLEGHEVALDAIAIHGGCTALDAARFAEPATVDLAFIDADHRHPWPTLDALALLPVMRPGGWMLLHDTRMAELAARHTRKTGDAAPWSHRGPANLHRHWPGRTIHAATETANVGAIRVEGDIACLRAALIRAIDASPWEIDPSDPMVRAVVDRLRPTAPIRVPAPARCAATGRDALRIALVTREFPPAFGGGIGTAMAHTAAALASAGNTVHVVTAGTGSRPTTEDTGSGVIVHRIPVRDARADWWASRLDFSARAAAIVEDLGSRGAIDVAEFPECEAPALMHSLAQARAGAVIPTVIQLHTPTEVLFALRSAAYDYPCAGLWSAIAGERAAVGLADAVYAPSRFIAEWAAQWWRLDETPDVVAYPHAPVLPKIAPIPDGANRIVLYAGRLEPRKGVVALAQAWNAVADRHPDAMVVLAGADTAHAISGGSVRRRMVSAMSECAAKRAIFAGPVPPAELCGLIDRASVCVVPSLWENFPNVAIEAMGRGRPIIASDRGGMAEMIGASRSGMTFPTGESDALAAALGAMLDESVDSLRARGAAARASIERICDPIETTRQRMNIYRGAIARAAHRDEGIRSQWVELGGAVLRATTGEGPRVDERPVPGFGAEIRRWITMPRRPAMSAA